MTVLKRAATKSDQGGAFMNARTRAVESIEHAKQQLDRALGELDAIRIHDPGVVGAVAHALSNYITVTTATVEMLQLTLRDHPERDVAVWLEGIGHAADLMQHAVGRLVASSSARDFPLKSDFVNLTILMERTCNYYRRLADARHVDIVCGAPGPVPLVWGDRVAIAVVAGNLLSNAVRFSPPHSTVSVQIMSEPGSAVCTVRDSGPGLTPEQQAMLMTWPPPRDPASDAAAAGFGLAVSIEFVRRMDGELWCESEPGKGARFSFRLPAQDRC
jgi:signal transduction histidine kinase